MHEDIGKVYNNLTVLNVKKDKNKKYWLCKCSLCGSEKWIRSDSVTSGKQKSCGCLRVATQFKYKDLTGQRFGRLIAIEKIGKINESECYYWKCKCDCGNEVIIRSDLLLSSRTKSCGCLQVETALSNKSIEKFNKKNIVENTNINIISRTTPIKSNTSGYTGVVWHSGKQKWKAEIYFQNKYYYLGYFEDKDEAIKAREKAENELFKPILDKYNEANNKDDKNK